MFFFKSDVFKGVVSFLIIGAFIILYTKTKENKELELLKESNCNWAVVTYKFRDKTGYSRIGIEHTVNKKVFLAREVHIDYACYSIIDIGDTLFIRYSLEEPTVVSLEACYWDRKVQLNKIE